MGADGANSVIRQALPHSLHDSSVWQSGLATAKHLIDRPLLLGKQLDACRKFLLRLGT
jgi:2-polyprenyl-6-methoxyphenol hydroxylase-like FAD-dependent oxidoreductase